MATPPPANLPVDAQELAVPVHAEKIGVERRKVQTGLVRVTRTTRTREQRVEQELIQEKIVVDRVPVGRVVAEAPPDRDEGDVKIISVVEEILVVERRLMLKEEIHIRRVKSTVPFAKTISLREQEAVITRTDIDRQTSDRLAADEAAPLRPTEEQA